MTRVLVGLGDPGQKYSNTRHNVGFMVVDKLANIWNLSWKMDKKSQTLKTLKVTKDSENILLAKPQTFMNESGKTIRKLVNNLYVIHDDLDIKLGNYKIQFGKGPKDHKGLISIYDKLGSRDFWHVRVGVDNRALDNRISGEEYVLQDFTQKELEVISQVIDKIVRELYGSFLPS